MTVLYPNLCNNKVCYKHIILCQSMSQLIKSQTVSTMLVNIMHINGILPDNWLYYIPINDTYSELSVFWQQKSRSTN